MNEGKWEIPSTPEVFDWAGEPITSEFPEYVKWTQEEHADGLIVLIRLGEREMLELVKANPEVAVWYMKAQDMELRGARRDVEDLTKQVSRLQSRLTFGDK